MSSVLTTSLQRERLALALTVLGIPALCWTWVIAMWRDMYGSMTGASAWMMSMDWDARRLVLLWAMWAAMMAGMMLPSAAPLLLLYGGASRGRHGGSDGPEQRQSPVLGLYALVGGYVTVWAAFSIGATILQRLLATSFLLTPMMEPAFPALSATILVSAGLYQLTPLKQVCLTRCRSPLSFLIEHWRGGIGGAFRMGTRHGAYCVGCCWVLMLILFAGGVMNLAVIGGLTTWVIVEKLSPFGPWSARLSGVVLLAAAAWLML